MFFAQFLPKLESDLVSTLPQLEHDHLTRHDARGMNLYLKENSCVITVGYLLIFCQRSKISFKPLEEVTSGLWVVRPSLTATAAPELPAGVWPLLGHLPPGCLLLMPGTQRGGGRALQ